MNLEQWQARFKTIKRSTILQSYHYAQAACKVQRQQARWGLITIDGKEAGLVQLLEAKILWGLFHAVILDRGPLWFDGFGGAAHIKVFFEQLDHEFSNRFGRKRRFIPEVESGLAAQQLLRQIKGLRHQEKQAGYQTLWWDIIIDDETACADLKGNWRSSLNKAERSNLTVLIDDQGKFYPWLKAIYKTDKQIKGYRGVSPQLLDNLALFSTSRDPMVILKAQKQGRDIAGVMFLVHGRSATYQIGWSSEEGRENNAHHLLLWQGRSVLKGYGVQEIDLGGINDETAAGVKKFKEGTNAKASSLIGHYT